MSSLLSICNCKNREEDFNHLKPFPSVCKKYKAFFADV